MATKTAKKIRITAIAKELGISAKDIIDKCVKEGVEGVTTPQASVAVGLAETIKEWFGSGHGSATAEVGDHVDVAAARERTKQAAIRKKGKIAKDEPSSDGTAVAEPAATAPAPTSATPSPVKASAEVAEPTVEKATTVQTPVAHTVPVADAGSAVEASRAPVPTVPPAVVAPPRVVAPPARITPPPPPAPPPPAAPARPVVPVKPAPMNVPTRPVRSQPAGEVLKQPAKTALSGPKVIRVERADNVPAPRPRTGPSFGGPGSVDVRPGIGGAGVRRPAGGPPRTGRPTDGGRSGRAGGDGAGAKFRTADLEERRNRLAGSGGYFKRHKQGTDRRPSSHTPRPAVVKPQGPVVIPDPVAVKELSELTGIKAAEIMKKSLLAGNMITINSALDGMTAAELMADFGIEVEIRQETSASVEIEQRAAKRTREDERGRPPVVTILGHVDHGKTTLLDTIRQTNVAAGEAGGITQSTRAFQVRVKAGGADREITFIDTPGHEAFTAMRSRGAKVTDVVVLVVDAVEGVMPQTIESISHAKAAGVAIIVALNKIDRPDFDEKNLQRVYGQLAAQDLNPVPWGGNVEVALVSGLKGTGIPELLELIALQADVLDLKADWKGSAQGTVLEARMEEGRGAVAQVLVQEGILARGDCVVVGRAYGRVRDILNDRGERTQKAGPTMPVAISGIDEIPDAGDKFYVVETLSAAEQAATERRAVERERELSSPKVTLDNIFETMANSKRKELPLIVKADVQGSLETLRVVLGRIKADDVTISIKHSAIGGINESDVELAATTGAVVVGFNVTSNAKARKLAEVRKIDIRLYEIIYQLTDDMEKAVRGLLEPETKLQVLGHADVRAVFKITKVGAIAGCYVTDGVVERNAQIRVTRDGIVIEKDRRLEQLKRFKEDVKEVRAGTECGMKINGYDDIREGDVLECYRTITVRALGSGNA